MTVEDRLDKSVPTNPKRRMRMKLISEPGVTHMIIHIIHNTAPFIRLQMCLTKPPTANKCACSDVRQVKITASIFDTAAIPLSYDARTRFDFISTAY